LTPTDLKVNALIKNFKQKVAYYRKNPTLKSDESLPADSVLWYLEATINYSHAFPNEYYAEMESTELVLTVPVDNSGEVDMAVLIQKYDEMKASITTVYNNSGFDNKGLVLVDILGSSQISGEITLEVEAVVGNKGIDPGPGPFVVGDDWWYGEFFGHCYPHTLDSDAAQKLALAMNSYITTQNTGFFFTNATNVTHKGGDFRRDGDPEPLDNIYDFYLYSTSTENGTITDENGVLCLNYNEMNVYYDLLNQLVYTKIPEAEMPPGYKIEKIMWMLGDKEDVEPYTHYYNKGKFKYGYPIAYLNGESPVDL
ncbi:MAG: hypothetical protein GXO89_00750, partial [Chlorobi bacterium]|nr:hypothetical protein [Chlorobiota bacterium]